MVFTTVKANLKLLISPIIDGFMLCLLHKYINLLHSKQNILTHALHCFEFPNKNILQFKLMSNFLVLQMSFIWDKRVCTNGHSQKRCYKVSFSILPKLHLSVILLNPFLHKLYLDLSGQND